MDASSLISKRNLELAWRRIVTGRNMQYKRFFRPIYMAYEVAYRENIDRLQRRLRGGWRPSPPTKIYLPKPSGLQRPISLLPIEDQILLQAIANVFATRLYSRRKRVEGNVVFSNLLGEPKDSVFFLEDWHETYSAFQTRCLQHYQQGYHWVAHFDLAAFYDTVSHDLLIRRVSPRGGNESSWNRVRGWLQIWSAADIRVSLRHGIPQGPIASDFLAECLLLTLDEAMIRQDIRYVRYVDDIRIFGRTKIEAQEAALNLEVSCRELGLIPQATKFTIEKATSLRQVLGILPSLAPPDRIEAGDPIAALCEEDALMQFSRAVNGRPLRIVDKSIVKFVLYRAPKSTRLLDQVLRLIPRHPEHIDAFAAYLSNYSKSTPTERMIERVLRSGTPYQYLRGELWHILGRIGTAERCQAMVPLALDDLRRTDAQFTLVWGALSFLILCSGKGLGSFIHRVRRKPPLVQALLVPILPASAYDKGGLIAEMLSSKDYLPGIMLAEQLVRRNETHKHFGLRVRDLAPEVQNTFRSLGLIRRRSAPQIDQIADVLRDRYNIPSLRKWRHVLQAEYPHALQILLQADALFDAGRAHWLRLQNSFNDVLTRTFITFLNTNTLPGARSLVGRDGRLVKYGSLLVIRSPLDLHHPNICAPFRELNSRRNTLPGTHPYNERGGAQTRFLSRPEQANLQARLRLGYSSLITFIDRNT